MGRQTWQRQILLLLTGLFGLLLIGESLISSAHWIGQPFPGFFVHENLTVGPYFLSGWSGPVAGIESLDRVVSVNGVTLRDRGQLYELVRRQPIGTSLDYLVCRLLFFCAAESLLCSFLCMTHPFPFFFFYEIFSVSLFFLSLSCGLLSVIHPLVRFFLLNRLSLRSRSELYQLLPGPPIASSLA